MKLEYLDDISDGGKYSGVVTDQLVRLYDFDDIQAKMFYEAIQQKIVGHKKDLDLKELDFIEKLNCNLTLRLADKDLGITTEDKKYFFCDLTETAYQIMLNLLESFYGKETSDYQWLYDLNTDIEFLFSPGGQW